MQPNTFIYVFAYIALMTPTYILPYLGSNSSIINAVSASIGLGMTPQWWAHAWSLTMLCLITWARSGIVGRAWLPILPVLATVFDLMPILSMIPLVPTLLHLGGILAGVIGVPERKDSTATQQMALNRKATRGAIAATACAVGGAVLFVVTSQSVAERLGAKPQEVSADTVVITAPPPATRLISSLSDQDSPADTIQAVSTVPIPARVTHISETKPDRMERRSSMNTTTEAMVKPEPASSGTAVRYISLDD